MGTLTDTYGKMRPGQLITADHWNALVGAIDNNLSSLETRLNQAITDQLQPLKGRVDTLEADYHTFKGKVDTITGQYSRLTIATTSEKYLLGDYAEITAKVTDLSGGPVAGRPWIDFVTTWGKLQAAPTYNSVSSVSDRALAVQVDGDGFAMVRVRAESMKSVTEDDEGHVYTYMATKPVAGSAKTFRKIVLESDSADDSTVSSIFKTVSDGYKNSAPGFRNFMDGYYLHHASAHAMSKAGSFYHDWQYYPCTVVAFVKNDNDPQTPDGARGAASLQVYFRDWIGPWINNDFLKVDDVADIIKEVGEKIEPTYDKSAAALKKYVTERMRGAGLLGRQRESLLVSQALKDLGRPPGYTDPPDTFEKLADGIQSMVLLQQTLDASQYTATFSDTQEYAMAYSGVAYQTASRADANIYTGKIDAVDTRAENTRRALDEAVKQIGELVAQKDDLFKRFDLAAQDVQGLRDSMSALQKLSEEIGTKFEAVKTTADNAGREVSRIGEKINGAISETGTMVNSMQGQLETMRGQVGMLVDLSPSKINTSIGQVAAMTTRLEGIEKAIKVLTK